MCPGRTAGQPTLLRFSAENMLSVVFSGLGLVRAEHPSFPLRNGRDGMMGFLVVSPCAVYCRQDISESVLLFVFRGRFIFDLTHRIFFSSSLAHLSSL